MTMMETVWTVLRTSGWGDKTSSYYQEKKWAVWKFHSLVDFHKTLDASQRLSSWLWKRAKCYVKQRLWAEQQHEMPRRKSSLFERYNAFQSPWESLVLVACDGWTTTPCQGYVEKVGAKWPNFWRKITLSGNFQPISFWKACGSKTRDLSKKKLWTELYDLVRSCVAKPALLLSVSLPPTSRISSESVATAKFEAPEHHESVDWNFTATPRRPS